MTPSPVRHRDVHACHWVQVATCDGLRLDGLLHDESWSPLAKSTPENRGVVLLMHGAGGNFYGPSLINRVGTHLFRLGWPVLRVNNRGHDGWHVAFRGGGVTQMGAAFERLEESLWDVQAWLGWLRRNGYRRVILAGHSLGAFKIVYALEQLRQIATGAEAASSDSADIKIETAIAISPPCLSQSLFESSSQSEVFVRTIRRCQTMREQGEEDLVFRAEYPFRMFISAGCYLNKYASGERFNLTQWHSRLNQPLLWIYGGDELASHEALARGVASLKEGLAENHRMIVVPNADHFFTGASRDVCVAAEHWLEPYRA
ncbi:MAG: alpha/beta fold hydrolase [Planctomycetaceae bacterium]|nr:alpha/beta fold hydrolase [Planctomycetaceae bacterium]